MNISTHEHHTNYEKYTRLSKYLPRSNTKSNSKSEKTTNNSSLSIQSIQMLVKDQVPL